MRLRRRARSSRIHVHSPASAHDQRSAPLAEPAFAWLLGLLALPWLLHTGLVLGSSLGATPLAGRASAWSLIVGSCAGAWLLGMVARRSLPAPPSAADDVPAEPPAPQLTRMLSALSLAGGVAFAFPLLSAALLPITAYDAIAYRLPVIAQWLDAGRIAWVSSDDPVRNGYPLGQEAVSALLAAASGSLRFAGMTSYLYVAAAAVAIAWLARACQVRAPVARAAAASFLLVPMLILNAPSGYVDAAFASACVCLFCGAALCGVLRPAALRPSPWLLLAAGMAAAHVLALKGTGLPFVVLVVGLCVLRALVQRAAPSLIAIGTFLLAAAPGLFWPLRNVVHTGNPLWPIRVSVGGKVLLAGVGSAEQILDVAANTPAQLAGHAPFTRVLLTWLQWRGPALDFDYRFSGLGYAWLLVALPALLALLFRLWRDASARARHAPVAFVALLTAACFALQPMAWWSRYTLWLWGAGALAIACQLEHALRRRDTRAQNLLVWALTLLSLSEAGFALAHVHGLQRAVERYMQPAAAHDSSFLQSLDLQHASQAKRWIAPDFWQLGLTRDARICRTQWKPNTDNANLDGVFAQLSPRPRLFVVRDERVSWAQTKQEWQRVGCPALLVFRGSPVLAAAQADPSVSVRSVRAFDPLYLLRPIP
jgi:hypothetical protein